jgi:hypothetical protein
MSEIFTTRLKIPHTGVDLVISRCPRGETLRETWAEDIGNKAASVAYFEHLNGAYDCTIDAMEGRCLICYDTIEICHGHCN